MNYKIDLVPPQNITRMWPKQLNIMFDSIMAENDP